METKYKEIPFDVNRVNEEGVQVITRDGKTVRIICTDCSGLGGKSLVALVNNNNIESVIKLYENGKFLNDADTNEDLIMFAPCDYRRMTNQELSWWLRDCPEEHRECKYSITSPHVYTDYNYPEANQNSSCDADIVVRRNDGAWEEPLIEN